MAAESAAFREFLRRVVRPEEGRVPALIHSSAEVHDLELECIFDRLWQLVAHESELAAAGDYVTRSLGNDPVIAVRGEDGRLRVFLNACRHRGMRVCRSDAGNSSHFRCPYHGFTYRNTGELIGVPFQQEAYDDGLDTGALALLEARVETYDGLIFATWDEAAEPLGEYLGDMRWYLDLLFRRADMEVAGPAQRRILPTNWKLPAENFASDSYHTMHSHASIAAVGLAPRVAQNTTGRKDFSKHGYHISAGRGHGLLLGVPAGSCGFPEELLPLYESRLEPAQYAVLKQIYNIAGLVFPNLSIQISPGQFHGRLVTHTSMNVYRPLGPDRVEVWSWFLVERQAPDEWKRLSRRLYTLTFSASGMFDQDDVENFSSMTATLRTRAAARSLTLNYGMGLGRVPATDFPGPGRVYRGKYSEANGRDFIRRWLDLVAGPQPQSAFQVPASRGDEQ